MKSTITSVKTFSAAMTMYIAPLLMQVPSCKVISQFFFIGVQAKMSASTNAILYETMRLVTAQQLHLNQTNFDNFW